MRISDWSSDVCSSDLLPSLNISGDGGTSALSLGKLTDVVTGGLFASIAQVIFDGGQRAAQVRSQQAAAEGAFANYKQTVLIALEDVEHALSALQAAQQRTGQFTIALHTAKNSAILARHPSQAGPTNFQTLLTTDHTT